MGGHEEQLRSDGMSLRKAQKAERIRFNMCFTDLSMEFEVVRRDKCGKALHLRYFCRHYER